MRKKLKEIYDDINNTATSNREKKILARFLEELWYIFFPELQIRQKYYVTDRFFAEVSDLLDKVSDKSSEEFIEVFAEEWLSWKELNHKSVN